MCRHHSISQTVTSRDVCIPKQRAVVFLYVMITSYSVGVYRNRSCAERLFVRGASADIEPTRSYHDYFLVFNYNVSSSATINGSLARQPGE